MKESRSTFVSTQAFDTGFSPSVASPQVQAREGEVRQYMREAGYDLSQVRSDSKGHTLHNLRNAAGALFLHWSHIRATEDKPAEFATAKLFNKVTTYARELRKSSAEITRLREAIVDGMRSGQDEYDPTRTAEALQTAARERKHEQAWSRVVLPTDPKQAYGRVRVDVVTVPGVDYNVYVTQPTFVQGRTLRHTHLYNWGAAAPLGEEGTNTHTNTLWQPKSEHEVFPLQQVDKTDYQAGEVVVIPPKAIHAIETKREGLPGLDLRDLAQHAPKEREALINSTNFGELSCLHVYGADPRLMREMYQKKGSLDGLAFHDFARRYDMVVVEEPTIWAGDGGAWERRQEGCQEGDHRSGALDPETVMKEFLTVPSPESILYSAAK